MAITEPVEKPPKCKWCDDEMPVGTVSREGKRVLVGRRCAEWLTTRMKDKSYKEGVPDDCR